MGNKPRFNWWPFALNMIKDYPARKQEYDLLHEQKITPALSGMPGGGSASRTVENIALKQLPWQEQKEYDAVRRAEELTLAEADGKIRMKVVELTLYKKRCNTAGAAIRLNISERTAQRHRWRFVILVGYTYGFLTKEEYEKLVKRDQGAT